MVNNSKLIFLFTSLFCWLIVTAFGSNTVSFLTNLKSTLPFIDEKSLILNTDYSIVIYHTANIVGNFQVRYLI